METHTPLIQHQHRNGMIFCLVIISIMILSCTESVLTNPAEGEGLTPQADVSNGLVMNGTGTVTLFTTKTCTSEGTAVLTVQPDKSFVLALTVPAVDFETCAPTGDQRTFKIRGTVVPASFELNTTSCGVDNSPVRETSGWITGVDSEGAATCMTVNPQGVPVAKFYTLSFSVKK
jgi:hypothetical protein